MVRDTNGCEGFWAGNLIKLADIPGPQVLQVIPTDETDGLQNGSINITATGSTPALYFSIDTLAGWQPDDGIFENLSAGTYTCVVRDENGCDTVFTVVLQNIILTWLQAVTGPGEHCLGTTATVPVEVDNFTSVSDFQLKISYNKDNLQCQGYTNVHPQLAASLTGWVDVATGEITLQWSGNDPVTFTGQQDVADLVFTTLQAGQGMLDWYTGAAGSYFTNPQGNPIPAEFHTGQVNIYEPPDIFLSPEKTVCEGQMVSIMGFASGNQPPFTYLWTYPDGTTTENDPFIFGASQANDGDYTLLVTDVMGCTDQKSVHLEVSPNPVAAFHGTDTLEVEPGYILSAGAGLAHYLWNTGDTTESIEITAEGMYAVGMESLLGCTGLDSVYIRLNEEPVTEPSKYFYIPNAFTPNGDGKNDNFKPVPTNPELPIVDFRLSIFDRWGGFIFEGDGISAGWDGTKNGVPCPGGVYVYQVTFRVEGVAEEQVISGTAAIVR
jgi:gliding motility-associated-like protein